MGTAKVLANIFGDAASGSFAVLEFSPEDFRAVGIRAAIAAGVALPPQVVQMAESASQDSLFNAIEKLGLKLESRKAPIEVLVIDHCEKAPTEN